MRPILLVAASLLLPLTLPPASSIQGAMQEAVCESGTLLAGDCASESSGAWSARYDGAAHGDDVPAAARASPDGSVVYVGGHSVDFSEEGPACFVLAYETASGALLWERPIAAGCFAVADVDIALAGAVVLVGYYTTEGVEQTNGVYWGDAARVVGVRASDGGIAWGPAQGRDISVVAGAAAFHVWELEGDVVRIDAATGAATRVANVPYLCDMVADPVHDRLYLLATRRVGDAFVPFRMALGPGGEAWAHVSRDEHNGCSPNQLAVSPDGRRLYFHDYEPPSQWMLHAYDAETGVEVMRAEDPWRTSAGSPPFSEYSIGSNLDMVGVGPGGSRIVGLDGSFGAVRAFTPAGEEAWSVGLEGRDFTAVLSPDGTLVHVAAYVEAVGGATVREGWALRVADGALVSTWRVEDASWTPTISSQFYMGPFSAWYDDPSIAQSVRGVLTATDAGVIASTHVRSAFTGVDVLTTMFAT